MVTLWSLVILSIIGVAIASLVFPQIRLAKVVQEKAVSLAAVEAALNYAFFSRYNDVTPGYNSLSELNQEVRLSLGPATATYHLVDEAGKININTAGKETLLRLPGINEEALADSIIAFRKKRIFLLREELLLVPGMSEQAFSQSQHLITVWTDGRVNINTAGAEALRALGLSEDLIILIMRYRAGNDGKPGKDFTDINTVINDLRDCFGLAVQQTAQLQNVLSRGLLSVKSDKFGLEAGVRYRNQPPRLYSVIFSVDDSRVLFWKED